MLRIAGFMLAGLCTSASASDGEWFSTRYDYPSPKAKKQVQTEIINRTRGFGSASHFVYEMSRDSEKAGEAIRSALGGLPSSFWTETTSQCQSKTQTEGIQCRAKLVSEIEDSAKMALDAFRSGIFPNDPNFPTLNRGTIREANRLCGEPPRGAMSEQYHDCLTGFLDTFRSRLANTRSRLNLAATHLHKVALLSERCEKAGMGNSACRPGRIRKGFRESVDAGMADSDSTTFAEIAAATGVPGSTGSASGRKAGQSGTPRHAGTTDQSARHPSVPKPSGSAAGAARGPYGPAPDAPGPQVPVPETEPTQLSGRGAPGGDPERGKKEGAGAGGGWGKGLPSPPRGREPDSNDLCPPHIREAGCGAPAAAGQTSPGDSVPGQYPFADLDEAARETGYEVAKTQLEDSLARKMADLLIRQYVESALLEGGPSLASTRDPASNISLSLDRIHAAGNCPLVRDQVALARKSAASLPEAELAKALFQSKESTALNARCMSAMNSRLNVLTHELAFDIKGTAAWMPQRKLDQAYEEARERVRKKAGSWTALGEAGAGLLYIDELGSNLITSLPVIRPALKEDGTISYLGAQSERRCGGLVPMNDLYCQALIREYVMLKESLRVRGAGSFLSDAVKSGGKEIPAFDVVAGRDGGTAADIDEIIRSCAGTGSGGSPAKATPKELAAIDTAMKGTAETRSARIENSLDLLGKLCDAKSREAILAAAIKDPGVMADFFGCEEHAFFPRLGFGLDVDRTATSEQCQAAQASKWVACQYYRDVEFKEGLWKDGAELAAAFGDALLLYGATSRIALKAGGAAVGALTGVGMTYMLMPSGEVIRTERGLPLALCSMGYGSSERECREISNDFLAAAKTNPEVRAYLNSAVMGGAYGTVVTGTLAASTQGRRVAMNEVQRARLAQLYDSLASVGSPRRALGTAEQSVVRHLETVMRREVQALDPKNTAVAGMDGQELARTIRYSFDDDTVRHVLPENSKAVSASAEQVDVPTVRYSFDEPTVHIIMLEKGKRAPPLKSSSSASAGSADAFSHDIEILTPDAPHPRGTPAGSSSATVSVDIVDGPPNLRETRAPFQNIPVRENPDFRNQLLNANKSNRTFDMSPDTAYPTYRRDPHTGALLPPKIAAPLPKPDELQFKPIGELKASARVNDWLPDQLEIPVQDVEQRLAAKLKSGMTLEKNVHFAGEGSASRVYLVHPDVPDSVKIQGREAVSDWVIRNSVVEKFRRPLPKGRDIPADQALKTDLIMTDLGMQMESHFTFRGKPLFRMARIYSKKPDHARGDITSEVAGDFEATDLAYAAECVLLKCGDMKASTRLLQKAGFGDTGGNVTEAGAREYLEHLGAVEEAQRRLHWMVIEYKDRNGLAQVGWHEEIAPNTQLLHATGTDHQRGLNLRWSSQERQFIFSEW